MFRKPTFNLTCRVWHAPGPGYPPPGAHVDFSCQLRTLKSVLAFGAFQTTVTASILLLPAQTDVRGPMSSSGADVIECPQGTGRYYVVRVVEDVARGFPNEYRAAVIVQVQVPTPLT